MDTSFGLLLSLTRQLDTHLHRLIIAWNHDVDGREVLARDLEFIEAQLGALHLVPTEEIGDETAKKHDY